MTPLKRRAAAIVAPALLALSLTACGGGPGSDAPDDASKEEFCEILTGEQAAIETADDANELADKYGDVGTPEEISGDAREGFEIFVDKLADISDDDIKDFEDAEDPSEVFDGDDAEKVSAFVSKSVEVCIGDLGDLPTDIPTDLPSDFPTDAPS